MLSDPAAAAWVAAGCPSVEAPATLEGRCGRCGTDGPTVPSSRVVSDKFAAFGSWPYGMDRLCVACAWTYSRPPNTQPALHITSTTCTEYIDSTQLLDLLCVGPLPHDHAVVVPATRRQHILPTAQWAHLATDGFLVRWDAGASQRLTDIARLRRLIEVANPKAPAWTLLSKPAPPSWLFRGQPKQRWAEILDAWPRLHPWRSIPQLWAAARRLTNAPLDQPTPGAAPIR